MSARTQRVFDWEKAGRDAEALDRHLRLAGLYEADRRLLVALKEHGQWVREGSTARSVLRATMRKVAQLADLSPGAVHKAKGRLVARGLMRFAPGSYVVSWARVWAMEPLPDPLEALGDRPDEAPGGTGPPVSAHGRSRPYQEQERSLHPPDPESNALPLDPDLTCVPIGAVLDSGVAAAAAAVYERQLDGLAERLRRRLEPVERRHGVGDRDRLDPAVARRIAAGICNDPESDVVDEVERVLGSLTRREVFEASPAAYLVACAKRRGWLPQRE